MAKIILIFAKSENGVIGSNDTDNPLPWHLPADTRYFKKTTIGDGNNIVVMGSRTWDTILEQYRPLDKRINIVLSRTRQFIHADVTVYGSIESLLDHIATLSEDTNVFIAGGLEIYRQLLPHADEVFVTEVHARVEGNVVWSDFALSSDWELISRTPHPKDEKNKYDMTFCVYRKRA